ncbi:MAG: DUF2513 domain-containing protein [Caldimicrobium sp.]|nr:DUF2513 domain-containing protein [Caldimicrobium sp.]
MKLDWELVREILLKLEELPEQEGRLMPHAFQPFHDWEKALNLWALLLSTTPLA